MADLFHSFFSIVVRIVVARTIKKVVCFLFVCLGVGGATTVILHFSGLLLCCDHVFLSLLATTAMLVLGHNAFHVVPSSFRRVDRQYHVLRFLCCGCSCTRLCVMFHNTFYVCRIHLCAMCFCQLFCFVEHDVFLTAVSIVALFSNLLLQCISNCSDFLLPPRFVSLASIIQVLVVRVSQPLCFVIVVGFAFHYASITVLTLVSSPFV